MPSLRIALAQIDMTVGDIAGNAAAVVSRTRAAAEAGAHLVAFPEMTLTGYPPEDLVLRESFRQASITALNELAPRLAREGLGEIAVAVGYLDSANGARNAAAVLYRGEVVSRYFKYHLPNYGVFDEARYFVPGHTLPVLRLHGVDMAVTICEDLWQEGRPFAVAGRADVGLVLSLNSSPYERNKDDVRLELAQRRAREAGATLAYVNTVGGQDELIFDGDSLVVNEHGELLARAPQFVETLFVVDLDLPAASSNFTGPALDMTVTRSTLSTEPAPAIQATEPTVAEPLSDEAEVYHALVTGLRGYLRKNGIARVYLGLSGGIDSSLTAAIACDAIGAENVYGISNPSAFSTEHSKTDAAELARRTGLNFSTIPIAPLFDTFTSLVKLSGLAEENLQARLRAVTWMAQSNQNEPSIVLACGNKSELATGYSTLYGDAVGGYAPLKDVPKTLVWQLARWRNAEAERRGETAPIPQHAIDKPPSAELRPGQLDSDSLPPYDVLDAVIEDYVDHDLGWSDLIERGHDPAVVEHVLRLVDRAEYKRRQYPPGPKISVKAFGRDRRLPITNRWRDTAPGHGGDTADAAEGATELGSTPRPGE
jgi:NAD+ synthase (glutamine-hydrolysing)